MYRFSMLSMLGDVDRLKLGACRAKGALEVSMHTDPKSLRWPDSRESIPEICVHCLILAVRSSVRVPELNPFFCSSQTRSL